MIKAISFMLLSCLSFYTVYFSFDKKLEEDKYEVVEYHEEEKEEIKNEIIQEEIIATNLSNEIEEDPIITIEIPKINLVGNIYSKNSKLNNIDKNIIIMDESDYPDKDNGIVIIGGHSGIGKIAYFKKLNILEENDLVSLNYNNKKYTYKVVEKHLDSKDGSIVINYNKDVNSRLYLYTCNPNDKKNYLVILCELI